MKTRIFRHAQRSWPHPERNDGGEKIACLVCDTLHDAADLEEGEAATCKRCGHVMYQNRHASLIRVACFSASALLLMIVAQSLPFLTLNAAGLQRELTLVNTATSLMTSDAPVLGCSVLFFTILAPLFLIIGMLYAATPLFFGRSWPLACQVLKWIYRTEPWNMVEVFLLGVLVSILKLAQVSEVAINLGFYSFAGVMICIAAALAGIDRRELWDRIEYAQHYKKNHETASR